MEARLRRVSEKPNGSGPCSNADRSDRRFLRSDERIAGVRKRGGKLSQAYPVPHHAVDSGADLEILQASAPAGSSSSAGPSSLRQPPQHRDFNQLRTAVSVEQQELRRNGTDAQQMPRPFGVVASSDLLDRTSGGSHQVGLAIPHKLSKTIPLLNGPYENNTPYVEIPYPSSIAPEYHTTSPNEDASSRRGHNEARPSGEVRPANTIITHRPALSWSNKSGPPASRPAGARFSFGEASSAVTEPSYTDSSIDWWRPELGFSSWISAGDRRVVARYPVPSKLDLKISDKRNRSIFQDLNSAREPITRESRIR